jgi:hypothetical protein
MSGSCSKNYGNNIYRLYIHILRFRLPKPFIPLTFPSSQSPGADTQRPCDELITRPRSPVDCPRSSNRNETESFMEAAKAQNWAVEPQGKKYIHIAIYRCNGSVERIVEELPFLLYATKILWNATTALLTNVKSKLLLGPRQPHSIFSFQAFTCFRMGPSLRRKGLVCVLLVTLSIYTDWLLNCCWPSLAQGFLDPSPAGIMT